MPRLKPRTRGGKKNLERVRERGGNREREEEEEESEREGECDKRHNVLRDAFGQSEHLSKQGSLNGRLTNGYGRERQRGGEEGCGWVLWEWGGEATPAHIQRGTKDCRCTHTHTRTNTKYHTHNSCNHQSFDTNFLQSIAEKAIQLLSSLGV